jgi:hypothetical protein
VSKEQQKTGKPGRPKGVEILGAKKKEDKTPEIVGGKGGKVDGPLKRLDSRSPVDNQTIEAYVHGTRKSFREEIDKDA